MFTQITEVMSGLMLLGTLTACTNVTSSDYDYASLEEDLRATGLSVDPHLMEESPILLVAGRRCKDVKL